ncbi:MAG: SPASM domain-containing protein [Candidatus Wallbacteria bacterium]|nr:SPASM domain-containing protein [Candidatus Wallbacteria bacterium]
MYRKILESLCRHETFFGVYNFYWFGEQLMHPEAAVFMDQTFESFLEFPFFEQFWLYTNGVYVEKKLLGRMLNLARHYTDNFSRVYFSLDSSNAEEFEAIKRTKDFARVRDNIREFVIRRQRMKLNRPQVVIGYIVLPENSSSLSVAVDEWRAFFDGLGLPLKVVIDSPHPTEDCLYFRVAYLPEQERFELLYQDACRKAGLLQDTGKKPGTILRHTTMVMTDDKTLKPVAKNRPACPAPFRNVTVNWDGRLAACCSDYEFEIRLPSLADVSIVEAWNSPDYYHLRRAHLLGDLRAYPRCEHCGNADTVPLSENEVKAFGEEYGKLWDVYLERMNE